MEQNITNVSSQRNKKPSKYPNFVRNLEILRQNGFFAEKKYASDFEIEDRATINALNLEDGGVKLVELLKKGISFGAIYSAADYGVSIGMILELLDLSQKIKRDIESGKAPIDVMFSGNARKGSWCAYFLAICLKELNVRELLCSSRYKGWLYLGDGISMIASNLSADVIKRIFPQRKYKYIFVFDQSSEAGEDEATKQSNQ